MYQNQKDTERLKKNPVPPPAPPPTTKDQLSTVVHNSGPSYLRAGGSLKPMN